MELHLPLILDGATGTQLQKYGFNNEQCSEQWTLEHPDIFIKIQKNYVESGSNVVYTGTFGANRVKLEEHGLFNKVDEYNQKLTQLSKEAVGGKALVCGDISPTGQFIEPMGDMSFEEMYEVYKEQAEALEKAGVDLFVIETMMTIPEARAALLAVKAVSKKPVFVTFTVDKSGKTLTGTDITAALIIMQGMGADAFGLNCSVGPEDMLSQIRRLSEYAKIPLIAKPNAGVPELVNGKNVYDLSPEEYIKFIPMFADYGVSIFGGCCGTDETYIQKIKEAVDKKTINVKPRMKYGVSVSGAAISGAADKKAPVLTLATEKQLFIIPADIKCGNILPCDEDLADNLEEEMENEPEIISIRISEEEDLDNFIEFQHMIKRPLCIACEDKTLLEEALRVYQGIALYEGSLPEEVLKPLSRKYGLIY